MRRWVGIDDLGVIDDRATVGRPFDGRGDRATLCEVARGAALADDELDQKAIVAVGEHVGAVAGIAVEGVDDTRR